MSATAVRVRIALGLDVLSVLVAVPLILLSEAHDAPGGGLLGVLLMIGTAAFGLRMVARSAGDGRVRGTKDGRGHSLEEELRLTQLEVGDLQGQVALLDEKLAFTQSLLESRAAANPALPSRA